MTCIANRVFLYMLLLTCIGCTKTTYIPIESTKIEYRDKLLRDSIHLYDSIYVSEKIKGDTVFFIQEKYRYLYRDKLLRDSIYLNDTIRVPVPVERQLSRWEKTKMDVGGWAIGAASGLIIIGVSYIVVWLRKKKTI